ncbi:MAG TPA: choice-of-anchor tandem repeat GloVer-containing protein, partial [Burkholderiaceae bacterium]|nr:choice-of-anchor tandem repeat GloVer-containing protein [Burkholderiaceae bacterium]
MNAKIALCPAVGQHQAPRHVAVARLHAACHQASALFAVAGVTLSLAACGGGGDAGSAAPAAQAAPTLQAIQVTEASPQLAAGTSEQLVATGIYSDNSHADVTSQVAWSSSNPAVANFGATAGQAAGVSPGSATLTARLQGQSGSAALTVTSATLVSIAINPPTASIAAGTSQAFTATGTFSDHSRQDVTADMTWSSASGAATVLGAGQAIGAGPGNATIVATCSVTRVCGSIFGSATLNVTPAYLVSIAISPPNPSIAAGTQQAFRATGTFSDNSQQDLTSTLTWTSSAAAATVASGGLATGVAAGTATIQAACSASSACVGIAGSTSLGVTAATPVSVAVSPPASSLMLLGRQKFTAVATFTDGSTQDVTSVATWSSSNAGNATVSNATNSNGVASALALGPTIVSATLGNVVSPPALLDITPDVMSTVASYTGRGHSTGKLLQAADGSLWGVTQNDGQNSAGTVYKLNADGTIVVVYNFGAQGGTDGVNPVDGLVQGTDGNFYGVTMGGGSAGRGTVFQLTPGGQLTVLHAFGGQPDGSQPMARLIQGADGQFYGTTQTGGANNAGTVFQVSPAGVETVIWSFGGTNDGQYPQAALLQSADGRLFGTTFGGGPNGMGTIFAVLPVPMPTIAATGLVSITTIGVETALWPFSGSNGDGSQPVAGLIQGADGNLYGTTETGGAVGLGTIFQLTAAGETAIWSFHGNDGSTPYGELVLASDGSFYGTTLWGGSHGVGT